MTPELPRAPMSAPLAIAPETTFAASLPLSYASSMVARMVRYMLVPVSPSGTGKTLMELIAWAFRSSQVVAAENISRRSPPE